MKNQLNAIGSVSNNIPQLAKEFQGMKHKVKTDNGVIEMTLSEMIGSSIGNTLPYLLAEIKGKQGFFENNKEKQKWQ